MLCSGALQAKTKDWMAELRAGAFIPTSGKIQRDFGHAWIEGEIEFDYMFVPHWQVWGNANYFYRHGHSARWDIKTDINIYPVSAGLKYVYAIGWFRPYVGFGPAYTFLHVRNHSHELS
jgi:outer membrane protein